MRRSLVYSALAVGAVLGVALGLSPQLKAQLTTLGPNVTTLSQSGAATMAAYPANAGRRMITVCAAGQAAHVTFGTLTPTAGNVGYALAAGACANFPPVALATGGGVGGQVNVISDTGTAVITFLEY